MPKSIHFAFRSHKIVVSSDLEPQWKIHANNHGFGYAGRKTLILVYLEPQRKKQPIATMFG